MISDPDPAYTEASLRLDASPHSLGAWDIPRRLIHSPISSGLIDDSYHPSDANGNGAGFGEVACMALSQVGVLTDTICVWYNKGKSLYRVELESSAYAYLTPPY